MLQKQRRSSSVFAYSKIRFSHDTAHLKHHFVRLRYEPCHEKTCFFCICENKNTDQLHSNGAADQCLCFHYTNSPFNS